MVKSPFRLIVSVNSSLVLPGRPKVVLVLVLVLLSSTLAPAQENASPNTKAVIWANAINLGTSFLNASAAHYGATQCLAENDHRGTALRGRFQHTLMVSLPADAIIGFASWKLRRHHPVAGIWMPSTAAGVQTGIAAVQYTQGCF
jgi:hypothetical protein